MPGGVNSPVRSFRGVGGTPPFIARASGSRVYDIDGNEYVDYVGSWGPMILGHAHPKVIAALQEALGRGTSYGAPTLLETELAKLVRQAVPAMELMRMVNSGTEATMSAIAWRAATRGVPASSSSRGATTVTPTRCSSRRAPAPHFGHPSSAGVPEGAARDTLVLPYNDLAAVEAAFAECGDEIAAVIVEPAAGNMNLVKPRPGFLEGLRALCDRHGAVLIFDEVMTGFRVGLQGMQGRTGIRPDLTTLGKVIGGGMPVAAFGGRREIMECVAPLGPVYQAGTLSGSPVAVAAGLASLELVAQPGFYERLEALTARLVSGLQRAAEEAGVPFAADSLGGMFGLYFAPQVPGSYAEVMACDVERFKRFFHAMLAAGHHFAPSAFEAGFVSAAHTEADIDATVEAAHRAFATLGHLE